MRQAIILTVLLCGSIFARADVFVEHKVRDFIEVEKSSSNKNERLPVLIVFKSQASGGATTVAALKEQMAKSVASLRGTLAWVRAGSYEELWILNGLLAQLNARELKRLSASPEVLGIYWSAKPYKMKEPKIQTSAGRPADYTYGLKKLNIPEVRKRFPHLLGTGVRVGVLDTGIASEHPDLRGRLKVFRNFSPAKETGPRDDFGHGTHVSGTIVGGSASGTHIGVAPEADLIVGRIFDGNGDSSRADILRSMQWMADPDGNPATDDYAQVVNSSWSDDDPFDERLPENEPFCQILKNWLRVGVIPVFSAGNTGPSVGTINLPAGCPEAFSVGATEQNDRSPHFSSTGPARWKGLDLMKPEVSAPGFHVYSAERYGRYEEMSGTSMAAPHVTGAFAILLQAFPNKSAEEIKRAMLDGAKDLGDAGQDAVFGYGRIDVLRSLEILEQRP